MAGLELLQTITDNLEGFQQIWLSLLNMISSAAPSLSMADIDLEFEEDIVMSDAA